MAEYIEKDALLKDLKDKCDYALSEYCWSGEYINGFTHATNIVNKALPLNVAIVKHGKWIDNQWIDYDEYLKCSECGAMVRQDSFFDDIGDWNYCPNCGAKCDLDSQARMDGDE